MLAVIRIVISTLLTMLVLLSGPALAAGGINIPILCYHNLNATVPGSMNMTPEKFEITNEMDKR